ncbi:hypothetical protein KY284_022398 [Solanum tuberosum]|nr:hypothetical protein KY284_022398 [Solanum tuberosum]
MATGEGGNASTKRTVRIYVGGLDHLQPFDSSEKSEERLQTGMKQIRIYFPKLGKIKPVSLRGSGKHKYSFQRVEVPSLPIHFCDCEEHSVATYTDEQKSLCNYDSKDEKDLNIMNSVLNSIFERENYSEKTPRYFKLTSKLKWQS